ncbi:acyltransferase family protein [Novosphingobium sp. 9U]|uniref:acyltransferase family protein n=1 Tax=Novosphingobium sp. 9U TaxID=2653158 RepID=UPI0012F39A7E|nr:acyltransferase family protein [Novosphingobium sp. 9U]VWX53322.1 Acyltransferase [Novosphingobium sp. 9U]
MSDIARSATSSKGDRATKPRRQDIQGLRAIGALLVATFHIWVGRVSGGVDVFFVVSGFLLVGSLDREYHETGGIDLPAFLSRLAKRLLPSSLFVVLIILVTAPLWMPQVGWSPLTSHAIASTLYLENWLLARSSVDYLARDEVASPFQHYWAMSAQVQSLVVIGALMSLLGLVLRRTTLDRKIASRTFLAVLMSVSLAYSVYATAANQPLAYFNTFARLWEFAMGGLVATTLPRLHLSELIRLIGGWVGLFLIVSCGVLLQVSTVFPGYAALWPTGGAALVLLCGSGKHPANVGRFLSLSPLTWLGDISYALYLWHWPLLIAYLTCSYHTVAPVGAGFGVLGLSVVLAWATTRFVERPFGKFRDAHIWRSLAVAGASAGLLVGGAAAGRVYLRMAAPADRLSKPDPLLYPGAAVFDRGYAATVGSVPVKPGPLWMQKDISPLYARGCHEALEGDKLRSCSYGNPSAPHVLAVVGGSHSAHWISALQIALKGTSWRMVTFTKSGCLLRSFEISDTSSCSRWNAKLMKRLVEIRPDVVFTLATHGNNGAKERVPQIFVDSWRTLVANGIAVAAIRDNPWFDFVVPECIQINGPNSERCRETRAAALASDPLAAGPPFSHVYYLDLTNYICTSTFCPTVAGNVVMYSDKHHITNTYMRTLAPYLARQLQPILVAEGTSKSE